MLELKTQIWQMPTTESTISLLETSHICTAQANKILPPHSLIHFSIKDLHLHFIRNLQIRTKIKSFMMNKNLTYTSKVSHCGVKKANKCLIRIRAEKIQTFTNHLIWEMRKEEGTSFSKMSSRRLDMYNLQKLVKEKCHLIRIVTMKKLEERSSERRS